MYVLPNFRNSFLRFAAMFLLASLLSAAGQPLYDAPQKKLIDFGWHSPSLRDLKDNLSLYESGPFDGVTVKLSPEVGGGNVFMIKDWQTVDEEVKKREIQLAGSISPRKVLTDNFLALYGASQMDWFSDQDWQLVEAHLRFAAQAAQAAGCKGILWDPEPYKPGKNPWKYTEQAKSDSIGFEAYWRQVHKRGRQFMATLRQEFPGIVVFSLRELSDWQQGSPFSGFLLPVSDKQTTAETLKQAWWGLHPAFYAGMLDAAGGDCRIIDGNEEAYYYTSALEYYQIRHTLQDDARAMLPTELWAKYACIQEIGHAVTPEYIIGNWLGMSPFPYRLTGQGLMMTPEERAQWFEHNVYYALRTSDEYAWLYTERMNWWTGENVPAGFKEALLRGKEKAVARQPLGFAIESMIKAAQDKAEEHYQSKQ